MVLIDKFIFGRYRYNHYLLGGYCCLVVFLIWGRWGNSMRPINHFLL